MTEYLRVNPCDRHDDGRETVLCPEDSPVLREENDSPGSDELLGRPTTLVPLAVRKLLVDLEGGMWGPSSSDIVEVAVTDQCLLTPRMH